MGYLQNQLRAQASILADDTATIADAPTGEIAAAAALAVPQADPPAAAVAEPAGPTAAEKAAAADLEARKQAARDFLAANP